MNQLLDTNYRIRRAILNMAQKKNQVVYGQQAVNVHVPIPFRRKTEDYDIKTGKAKISAEMLANELNKEYGTNKFKVVAGQHKGTFKVKLGDKTIADYTQTTKYPKSKKVFGVKYADLSYQENKLKRIIKDETLSYRHEKDLNTLNKIRASSKAWLVEGL